MRGEISSAKFDKRHPLDWYVEQGWEWDQVVAAIGLEPELADDVTIWDPACGFGHSLSRLQAWVPSSQLLLSDLVDNVAWADFDEAWDDVRPRPTFRSLNFFFDGGNTIASDRDFVPPQRCSIFCNPPYSYEKIDGEIISQAFARQALRLATHRVVFLLPLKWLAGQSRGRFLREHPPQQILMFTQRPSMPPGDRIHLMGSRAYAGGMVDYCAVVWNQRVKTLPGETRVLWLPPLGGKF